ncbi:TPA: hypothetical protein N0F65_008408 [Lagenidium giganteum]|uniref:Short-chain dehydrogenase/reductase 3 n=1 Tax=Lagenidium giganteum TaxID=4803 RepID=A0AAV2Z0G8_9STRA|nr:TPA: hypothetical protein N0F65_008408 [Lagenidium giganteum]
MGLGRLLALRFAKLGARVIIWDLNEKLGDETVNEIQAMGGKAWFYQMDVTDRAKVYKVGQQMLDEHGSVDILINNAGIVSGAPLVESPDALIERTMNVNALSHFWTIKAFLPSMVKRKKGHVVSIASAAGIFGCGGMVDYCASKSAAIGIMVSLRYELEMMNAENVHCTVVCPSFIKTGMFEGVTPPRLTSWLTPEFVADQIVYAVRRNHWRVLLPSLLYVFELLLHLLPDWLARLLGRFTNVAHSMKTFTQTRPHAMLENK